MAQFSLKPSSKGVTALIIVAALVVFGVVLSFVAAFGKIKSQDAKCADMEKRVADSRMMAQKLEKTRLAYLDTCSQIRFLESSVTTQAYVPTLLQQLELLGKSVNLKVLGVRPKPKTIVPVAKPGAKAADSSADASKAAPTGDVAAKKGPYDEMSIDIDVEGSFNNALDFLYKLTSFPKIIAVNNVQIAPASTEKSMGSPRLSIKLNITAYVLKETPASAPKSPTQNLTGKNTSGEGGLEMKLDKKQLPQVAVMAVLLLVLVSVGYISFRAAAPAQNPPPAPLKVAPKVKSEQSAVNGRQSAVDGQQSPLPIALAAAMPTLPRRDPFAQQVMPGEKSDLAPKSPKPTPARAAAVVSSGKVPSFRPINPFSQGFDGRSPVVTQMRPADQEKEPNFVLTGVVRGGQNVAIFRVGDKERHIVKQGQMVDGGYMLLSVTDDGAVLVHKNRRIHVKIGGVKNAS